MLRTSFSLRCAFTLVELLVVIAIIGILVALLLPAVQAAREAARRMTCSNNMHQIALGLQNYHDAIGVYPPGGLTSNETSWTVHVLPYLELGALYDRFDFSNGQYDQAAGHAGRGGMGLNKVSPYLCPSSPAQKMMIGGVNNVVDTDRAPPVASGAPCYTTHYYGNMGPKPPAPAGFTYNANTSGSHGGYSLDGVFAPNSRINASEITDGTSGTLLLGENSYHDPKFGSRFRNWMRGARTNEWIAGARNIVNGINTRTPAASTTFNDIAMASHHKGGAMFALCDGSVRFLSDNINLGTYKALASRNGGEAESPP